MCPYTTDKIIQVIVWCMHVRVFVAAFNFIAYLPLDLRPNVNRADPWDDELPGGCGRVDCWAAAGQSRDHINTQQRVQQKQITFISRTLYRGAIIFPSTHTENETKNKQTEVTEEDSGKS